MTYRLLPTVICLAWCTGTCHSALAAAPSHSGAGPAATPKAFDQSVRAALQQELEGKNSERNALLQQVLEQSPDHPQAHWHLGQVEADGKWMPWERVVDDAEDRWLAMVLDKSDLTTPQQWWDWWNGYQQVYVSGPKPQIRNDYEEFWTVDRRRRIQRTPAPQVFSTPRASCFAAGTPVVTEYGPKPIEEVELGDRVLSQDIESGELAFKPVFKATVRPLVRLMKITTDRGVLICTSGHPFWVNGESWLYARELQPGMRFHSTGGASEILSVEDAGREEKAYNLIVADFHTYFVGDGKILSHDNTPRAPTNALVPGLMPEYASAEPAP